MTARKIVYFLRAWFHIWLVTKYAKIIYWAIYCVRGPTVFFFLDKILSIDKIDSLYSHGSLQCVVIQKFSLNVVQSSNFIHVLILTKNHHFSKLVLIYGITTMKSTYHSNGSSSYSVIQNLVPNFRCSANVCSSLRWSS